MKSNRVAVVKAKVNDYPIIFVGMGETSLAAQQGAMSQLREFRKRLTVEWHAACVQKKQIFHFPEITLIETVFPNPLTSDKN